MFRVLSVLYRSGEERGTYQQMPGFTRDGPNVRIINVNQKIDIKNRESKELSVALNKLPETYL